MSESSEPVARRGLVVETNTPGAEIYALNAAGEVAAKGVARLLATLPTGLYKLRYRVGDRVTDQLFELPEGEGDFRVESPRLPFETPAPIARLGETLPAKAEIARRLSLSRPIPHGSGSRLLLFVDARQAPRRSFRLELRSFAGTLLESVGGGDLPPGYLGCHVELDPGAYLLRAEDIEQSVVTAAGWQTQVFIPLIEQGPDGSLVAGNGGNSEVSAEAPPNTDDAGRWQTDLTRCAILMPRIEDGFEPSQPHLRWIEVAREALAARRVAAADRELMNLLLIEKFDDPMLGILGGHLLLLRKEPDRKLLSELVRNLERLVPGHPDVRALLFDAGDPRAANEVFVAPPMLRSSWSRVLRQSRPGVDPFAPQSYASRIGGTLWGAGAWLTWKTPPETSSVKSVDAASDLQQFFQSVAARLVPQDSVAREDLSPTERALLAYTKGTLDQLSVEKRFTELADSGSKWFSWIAPAWRLVQSSEVEKKAQDPATSALDLNQLAALTGISIGALADAAASLNQKFGGRRGSSQPISVGGPPTRSSGRRPMKAHIVGGGFGGLAAAGYLIRNAGVPGQDITIYEADERMGGGVFLRGNAESGYSLPGSVFDAEFRCAFDLLDAIPSASSRAISVKDEFYAFNRSRPFEDRARLIDRNGHFVHGPRFGLSFRDSFDLARLALTPEAKLDGRRIEEFFSAQFFSTEFWLCCSTIMGPLPQHSATELRRYLNRTMHIIPYISDMANIWRTPFDLYQTFIEPLVAWLRARGVNLQTGVLVRDVGFAELPGRITVNRLDNEQDGATSSVTVAPDDLVLLTLGSQAADMSVGSMTEAPRPQHAGRSWALWKSLAQRRPDFGNPDAFFGATHVPDSHWVTFTVTTTGTEFLDLMSTLTGSEAGRGGLVSLIDSGWLLSLSIFDQPGIADQPPGTYVWWGYGLFPERTGRFVQKRMNACTGAEILEEVLRQLRFDRQLDAIMASSICIPCDMPYANNIWMTRTHTDKPRPVPEGSTNLGLIGQYVEVSQDVASTIEYSARTAWEAIYLLLKRGPAPPPVYQAQYDPAALFAWLKLATAGP
jgi:oleate hydratase